MESEYEVSEFDSQSILLLTEREDFENFEFLNEKFGFIVKCLVVRDIEASENIVEEYPLDKEEPEIAENKKNIFNKNDHFSIFAKTFSLPKDQEVLKKFLNSFIFIPFKNLDNNSDNSNLLLNRCLQLVIANYILEVKIYKYLFDNHKIDFEKEEIKDSLHLLIDNENLSDLKSEVMSLFCCENIPVQKAAVHPDYMFLIENFPEIMSFIDLFKQKGRMFKVSKIIPLLSLSMLVKCNTYKTNKNNNIEKCITVFKEIINKFHILQQSLDIFFFVKDFDEQSILDRCFYCLDLKNPKFIHGYTTNDQMNSYVKNPTRFQLVFLKVNLHQNTSNKFESIKSIFEISGNRGFITTLNEDYVYVIGVKDDNFIYMSGKRSEQNDCNLTSDNLFFCDDSKICTNEIIIVFGFKTQAEFESMMKGIKAHSCSNNKLFEIKKKQSDTDSIASSYFNENVIKEEGFASFDFS